MILTLKDKTFFVAQKMNGHMFVKVIKEKHEGNPFFVWFLCQHPRKWGFCFSSWDIPIWFRVGGRGARRDTLKTIFFSAGAAENWEDCFSFPPSSLSSVVFPHGIGAKIGKEMARHTINVDDFLQSINRLHVSVCIFQASCLGLWKIMNRICWFKMHQSKSFIGKNQFSPSNWIFLIWLGLGHRCVITHCECRYKCFC